jgi:hypothetical protein
MGIHHENWFKLRNRKNRQGIGRFAWKPKLRRWFLVRTLIVTSLSIVAVICTALGIALATTPSPKKAHALRSDQLVFDGQINSKPAWSLDGKTIFFHRMVPPEYRFRVFRISVDGTKLNELSLGSKGTSEFPAN